MGVTGVLVVGVEGVVGGQGVVVVVLVTILNSKTFWSLKKSKMFLIKDVSIL